MKTGSIKVEVIRRFSGVGVVFSKIEPTYIGTNLGNNQSASTAAFFGAFVTLVSTRIGLLGTRGPVSAQMRQTTMHIHVTIGQFERLASNKSRFTLFGQITSDYVFQNGFKLLVVM